MFINKLPSLLVVAGNVQQSRGGGREGHSCTCSLNWSKRCLTRTGDVPWETLRLGRSTKVGQLEVKGSNGVETYIEYSIVEYSIVEYSMVATSIV